MMDSTFTLTDIPDPTCFDPAFDLSDTPNEQEDYHDTDIDDDPAEQEQFDRISEILSQLIQEANDAIQSTSTSTSLSNPSLDTSTIPVDDMPLSPSTSTKRRRSRLPRPKRLSLGTIHQPHYYRHRSPSSVSSTTTTSSISSPLSVSLSSSSSFDDYDDDALFSPISSVLATPMSRTISPLLFEKQMYSSTNEMDLITDQQDTAAATTTYNDDASSFPHPQDPLATSFERLDTSLAIVDYLSRDLANFRRHHHPSVTANECIPFNDTTTTTPADPPLNSKKGTLLLVVVVPLLYLPYLLLTTTTTESLSPIAGLVVFFLCIAIISLFLKADPPIETDRSATKMIRRSSLPVVPLSSPSFSRRYSF
jgi:hypothetical protein